MSIEYHVKLIEQNNIQTLPIPQELTLSTSEVIIRLEEGKPIVEPYKKKTLLEAFANFDDIDEEFPDVDERL